MAPSHDDARARFDAVYRTHLAAVTAWAARRTDPATVHDIVAETFLVAWRRIDVVPDDALPWLLTTAHHILAGTRRADRRRHALAQRLEAEGHSVADLAVPTPIDPELESALRALDPDDRELILLVAWEELTPTQAAQVIGLSPVATRVRLHRLRRRLVRELRRWHRAEASGGGIPPHANAEALSDE